MTAQVAEIEFHPHKKQEENQSELAENCEDLGKQCVQNLRRGACGWRWKNRVEPGGLELAQHGRAQN